MLRRPRGGSRDDLTEWETSTPEAEGADSSALAKLVAYGKARSFDSLLIARHGRIVLDAYFAPYTAEIPHIANSVAKAVAGTLIAIALKEDPLNSLDHRCWSSSRTAKSKVWRTAAGNAHRRRARRRSSSITRWRTAQRWEVGGISASSTGAGAWHGLFTESCERCSNLCLNVVQDAGMDVNIVHTHLSAAPCAKPGEGVQ